MGMENGNAEREREWEWKNDFGWKSLSSSSI